MLDFRRQNPKAETDEQFENWLKVKIQERKRSNLSQSNVYTIPVIFHIVHNGEAVGTGSNLAASKIASQLEQLNADFANQSGSTYPVAANIEIQFCTALIGPNNNMLAEPGIERIKWTDKGWSEPPYNGNSFFSYVDRTIMPQSIWDPNKYLNVWVLDLAGDLFGKATYPVSSTLGGLQSINPDSDTHSGVFVTWKAIGSVNNMGELNIFKGLGRVLTHEVGHFLGLRHIWGDGIGHCNYWNTDYCEDTPPQRDETNGCPTNTNNHPQFKQNCPNIGDGSQRMFENYMDYTDDNCLNTFTNNQKTRMQTVMANSPRRKELAISTVCCIEPDLTIIYQSIMPTSVENGNMVTVYFVEDNNGRSGAGPNYVNFHLSADDVLTPGQNGDIYLGQYFVNQTIAPFSQTILLNKQILIPTSVTPGSYYLFFAADGAQDITECDEYNNFATAIVIVTNAPPPPTQSAYRYWFDNQFANAVTVNLTQVSNYHLINNVATNILNSGLHSINVVFKDDNNKWSSIVTSLFYKLSVQPPAGSSKYEYWIDNNYSGKIVQNITTTSNLIIIDDIWSDELTDGLHTLNIRFKPDGKHWSSTIVSFFYKVNSSEPMGAAQYEYWFDNDYAGKLNSGIASTGNLVILDNIATTTLSNGVHTINIRFKPDGKHWSCASTSFFYKPNTSFPLGAAQYEYWFDNNYAAKTNINISSTNNLVVLESILTSGLANGLHSINSRFKPDGANWSSVTSDFFYKANNSGGSINKYQYWFDNKVVDSVTVTVSSTNNLLLLDSLITGSLPNGLHTFNVRYMQTNGLWSSITSDFFYKNQPTGTTPNYIATYKYWYDDNWQNPTSLFFSGAQNLLLDINTDADSLTEGRHKISMIVKDNWDKWSAIVSDSFTRAPVTQFICPANRKFYTGITHLAGYTYQWQANTGSGFVNIADGAVYSGTTTDTLLLTNAPTSWYGTIYRCMINTGSGIVTSPSYILKFWLSWNGSVSKAWENPANWNCNQIPDGNIDVSINPGAANYPEINTSGTCRSLSAKPGVSVTVKTGASFIITH
ncbi:MAG: M43 family zinc metalloprotease [Ferruginibacter sp.]